MPRGVSGKINKLFASILLMSLLAGNIHPLVFADLSSISVSDSFDLAYETGDPEDIPLWNYVTGWDQSGGTEDADTRLSADDGLMGSPSEYHARLRLGGTITRTFDTTGQKNIRLHYFWHGDARADTSLDTLDVYWKKSTDSDFTLLRSHELQGNDTWSSEIIIDLPIDADNSSIDIQFVGNSDSATEEGRIDDVALSGDTIDTIAPVLSEVTPVPEHVNNRKPNYTFQSTESGSITFEGYCTSDTLNALPSLNTMTLLFQEISDDGSYTKIDNEGSFPDGYFANCRMTVTDASGNVSLSLPLTPFFVDGTGPNITINPYNTLPTRSDVVVTASTDEGTLNETSHTFTTNGSFVFSASDSLGNVTNKTVTITNIDKTAPIITTVTSVPVKTNSHTPTFTFNTTESGSITYGGACSSLVTDAVVGDNVITFQNLPDGTYSNCTITLTDTLGNVSSALGIPAFNIDSVVPQILEVTPIVSPTKNPTYIFTTDKSGTTVFQGGCSSSISSVGVGQNTLQITVPSDGTYNSCTLTLVDDAGNTSNTLSLNSFTLDTTSPLISDTASVTFLPPGVSLNWTTNESSTTKVEYGLTSSYGSVSSSSLLTTSHVVTLTGLNPATTYHFRLISTDAIGNETVGSDNTFTTGTSPVVENVGGGGGGLVVLIPNPIPSPIPPVVTLPDPVFSDIPLPSSEPEKPIIPRPIVVPIPSQNNISSNLTDDTPKVIDRGGGVVQNIKSTDKPEFQTTLDKGGGVLPEEKSYTLLWIFLGLFGLLNYWWFFIAKRDEEEEEKEIVVKKSLRKKK